MADSLEPYEGGVVGPEGGPEGGQYTDVGVMASLNLWADLDECAGTTKTVEKYCESYTQCTDGVEADLRSLPNVDHRPYGNSLGFDVASVAWNMFKRQPMKYRMRATLAGARVVRVRLKRADVAVESQRRLVDP